MLPLQGIRVVEIAQNLAGPYCAEILAHLGADVVKVERPEGGDDTRGWGPPFLEDAGSSFHAVNLGKRSIAVDLKSADEVARLLRLIDNADVLVQNLRPGAMDALGLDGPALMRRNPKLIVFQGFEARNGPLVIAAANDRLFAKLAGALGRPDWARDPRFANNAGRYEHRDEILAEVARIVATRTKGEWIDILEAAGVPCAPINTLPEMLAEPQTEAVGMLMQVPGLDLRLMGLPFMLDGVRPPISRRAPKLGEHTDEVFENR